jgi:cytochrome P450
MERNNDLLFGYGKYQCLGKPVAMMELNKIFVELMRRFEFTLLDPDNPWKTRCFGIHLQEGLWMTMKTRSVTKGVTAG